MRQLKQTFIVLVLMSLLALTAAAQDDTSTAPPSAEPTPTLEELLARVDALSEEAQTALERAQEQSDLAFNLLGIFEAVSVAITIVGAGLGFFGFGRLVSAENSLTQARAEVEKEILQIRQQFETDLELRRREFEALSSQLSEIVERQRREAANATLATALLSFGERQYRAADYVGAVTTYRRALELDDNNPVTYYRLGYVYTAQGDLTAAEEHLTKSLEIDNAFAPAMVALGFVYRRMGEKMGEGIEREEMFNRAENRMLEGLRVSPKLIDEDGESWWGALGGLYRRRGQVKQAIYAYEQGTTVTPHSSYPFGNLANLYGRENKIEDMLRMYKRVERLAFAEVQAEVDNYWGYFDLLTAQLSQGHTQQAEEILPSVLETVPADAVYALESLVDTLGRVADLLKQDYPDRHASMTDIAARIEAHIRERKANPNVIPTIARPEESPAQLSTTETEALSPPEDTPPSA